MTESSSPIDVVALGARLPVGLTPETAAAAIRANIGRVGEHPYLLDAAGDPLKCARDLLLDQASHGLDRLVPMLEHVVEQVAECLPRTARTVCLLALPDERPGFEAVAGAELIERLRESPVGRASHFEFAVRGRGHAGVFEGLVEAQNLLVTDAAEACVVAGVDSYLHADTLAWLERDRRVARDGARAGFIPGEGAAGCALMTERTRKRLSLPSLARLRSIGRAIEPKQLGCHEGLLGEGLSLAVAAATAQLAPDDVITDVYADINGERHRAEDWGFTLLRSSAPWRDGTRYVTTAGNCGDIGAATPALQLLLAARAWARGYATGLRALAFAGSWSGARGAALLEAGESARCRPLP